VSFPRAFISSGASAVIASLWLVEDETTASLMSKFYSNLARSKRIGESLVDAQRQFIAEAKSAGKPAHPFYWAPFFLVGDGR
jgi:CHAT domain-containing protein